MINLFAAVGLTLLILVGLLLVGSFIRWLHSDDDYYLPWFVTCLFYAITLALLIVSNMT